MDALIDIPETSTIQHGAKMNIPEIVKEYGDRLKGFIRKRVKSLDDADDIMQEVFYELAEAERLMKPVDQVAAWLYTVARNRITDLYRKKKTALLPEFTSDNEEEVFIGELNAILFDNGSNPETEYIRALVWEELEKALLELPPEQRQVFEMNELEGISFKAISELTGEAVNTLISRKRYAVLHLRDRLHTVYDELINF